MKSKFKIAIKTLTLKYLSKSLLPNNVRRFLLKKSGVSIGNDCTFRFGTFINSPRVLFGNNVFVNHNCLFVVGVGDAKIKVEDNVQIGPECCFFFDTHEIGPSSQRAGEHIFQSINIKKGVWIGANVTVLPGVTIGEGCVIGAGAVVNRDCDSNSIYVGVPAKKLRDLS